MEEYGRSIRGQFNARREQLGMSCAVIAARSSLSLRTVQRVLSGEETDPGFLTVTSMASALGLSMRFEGEDVDTMQKRRAEEKANQIVGMLQGSFALEAQALPEDVLKSMKDKTMRELLAGSRRRLWAE
jgi:hypothetical protein